MAECMELPVVTQGSTLDEVTQNLREAIVLHLEGERYRDLPGYSATGRQVCFNRGTFSSFLYLTPLSLKPFAPIHP